MVSRGLTSLGILKDLESYTITDSSVKGLGAPALLKSKYITRLRMDVRILVLGLVLSQLECATLFRKGKSGITVKFVILY